jgi:hypothetical protein
LNGENLKYFQIYENICGNISKSFRFNKTDFIEIQSTF